MKRTSWVLGLSTIASIAVFSPLFFDFPLVVTYNSSPSAPTGFYWIDRNGELKRGAYILIPTPRAFRFLVAKRHYLSVSIPLLKRVAALPGDVVCRQNEAVLINGTQVAKALREDSTGRFLPIWSGCKTLQAEEFFALNDAPNSLDSRTFGPLKTQNIIGIAIPLYLWLSETSKPLPDQKAKRNAKPKG